MIPFSKQQYSKEIVEKKLETFNKLSKLDVETKSDSSVLLEEMLTETVQIEFYTKFVDYKLGYVGEIILFVSIFVLPLILVWFLDSQYDSWFFIVKVYFFLWINGFSLLILIILIFIILSPLAIVLGYFSPFDKDYLLDTLFILIIFLIFPILFFLNQEIFSHYFSLMDFNSSFVIGLISVAILFVMAILGNILKMLILLPFKFYARDKMYYKTNTIIVNEMLSLCVKIEDSSDKWNDYKFKQETCFELEKISHLIERMERRIKVRDIETEIWFKDYNNKIANNFRSKKKLVLNPTSTSRDVLLDNLSKSLLYIIRGDWGDLEKVDSLLDKNSNYWLFRLLSGLKLILISTIPLILIFLHQLTPLKIEQPFLEYLKIGGLIWFIISVLIAIDPEYSDKTSFIDKLKRKIPGI